MFTFHFTVFRFVCVWICLWEGLGHGDFVLWFEFCGSATNNVMWKVGFVSWENAVATFFSFRYLDLFFGRNLSFFVLCSFLFLPWTDFFSLDSTATWTESYFGCFSNLDRFPLIPAGNWGFFWRLLMNWSLMSQLQFLFFESFWLQFSFVLPLFLAP